MRIAGRVLGVHVVDRPAEARDQGAVLGLVLRVLRRGHQGRIDLRDALEAEDVLAVDVVEVDRDQGLVGDVARPLRRPVVVHDEVAVADQVPDRG